MSNDDKDEAPGILPYVIVGIAAVIVSMLLAYLLSVRVMVHVAHGRHEHARIAQEEAERIATELAVATDSELSRALARSRATFQVG